MPCRSGRASFLVLTGSDAYVSKGPHQNRSYVVVAAGSLGGVDKARALLVESTCFSQQGGDAVIGKFSGQAVGTEQKDVILLEVESGNIGRDGVLCADGAGNDITQRRVLGLVLSELSEAHLLVDERMVVRLAHQLAFAKEVASAVADVSDQSAVSAYGKGDQSRSHAAQGSVVLGTRVNALVGVGDRLFQDLASVFLRARGTEALDEGVDGDSARDFAGSGSAHAIAQSEDSVFDTISKSIFVRGSNLSDIGAARGFQF